MKTGEMLWNYSRGIDNRVVGVIQVGRLGYFLVAFQASSSYGVE